MPAGGQGHVRQGNRPGRHTRRGSERAGGDALEGVVRKSAAGTKEAPRPTATSAKVVRTRGDSCTTMGVKPWVRNMAKIASYSTEHLAVGTG